MQRVVRAFFDFVHHLARHSSPQALNTALQSAYEVLAKSTKQDHMTVPAYLADLRDRMGPRFTEADAHLFEKIVALDKIHTKRLVN